MRKELMCRGYLIHNYAYWQDVLIGIEAFSSQGKNGTLGKWECWFFFFFTKFFYYKTSNSPKISPHAHHPNSAIVKILPYLFHPLLPLCWHSLKKSQTSCHFTHLCYTSIKSRIFSYMTMLSLSHLTKLAVIFWQFPILNL